MTYQSGLVSGDDSNVTKLYGERTVLTSCKYLLPHIKPNANILDVGCGPGVITSDLSNLAPEGQTTGVDIFAGIIAEAQAAFPSSTNPNLRYAVGDATNLSDLSDNTFDIVHAHQVLMHIKDPVIALKEFRRVCKPGGLVACRDSSPSVVLSLKPDLPGIRQYWDRVNSVLGKMGSHLDAGLKLESWAMEAGFGSDGGRILTSKSRALNTSHLQRVQGDPAKQIVQHGMATEDEVRLWRDAWEEWEATEGREFVLEAGEILCWKGT